MIANKTDAATLRALDESPVKLPKHEFKNNEVGHEEFIAAVRRALLLKNVQATNLNLDTSVEGAACLFSMDIHLPERVLPPRARLCVGGVNSRAHRRPCRLYGGVVTGTGETAVFYQSEPLTTRAGLTMEYLVELAVRELLVHSKNWYKEYLALDSTPIDNGEYNRLIIEAARSVLVPYKRLSSLDKNREPAGETAWSVLMKVSHASSPKQVFNKPMKDKLQLLYEFLDRQLRPLVLKEKVTA